MTSRLNILGVITARGGSKGLPGKNIKLLHGRPLISYSISAVQKSTLVSRLIVSTDDEEIASVARAEGGEVPFIRPAELAQDDTPHLPVMQHAVSFMENQEGLTYDMAVIFQPTSPFRLVEDIDLTIQKLIDHPEADSAVSLCEVEGSAHPLKVKKMEGDSVVSYCMEESEGMRRQDFPMAYKRSGAVYVIRRETLLQKERLYGDLVVGHIVPKERSIDIDTPLDWVRAEYILDELKRKGYAF